MFADAHEVVVAVNSCGWLSSFAASCTVDAAEALSGGSANAVFRLHLRPTNAGGSPAAPEPRTAVFKFYPPFVRSNSTVHFSQDRYYVEKAALTTLAASQATAAVRVPRVYYTDDAMKFIIMEDIGEACVSLMHYFSHNNTAVSAALAALSPEHLGQQLAAFLATLYAADVTQLPDCFHNPAAWAVLDSHVHQRFAANLDSLGLLPDLASWLSRARPACEPREHVLIMGDLWPNSVYINPRTHDIWLLDWELARFGSPLSDSRQMLVNLFIMEHSPAKYRVEDVARFRKALVRGVTGAMGRAFGEPEHADFMVLLAAIISNEFWQCEAPGNLMRAASAGCDAYLSCQ